MDSTVQVKAEAVAQESIMQPRHHRLHGLVMEVPGCVTKIAT
jgi:hypothetical protein